MTHNESLKMSQRRGEDLTFPNVHDNREQLELTRKANIHQYNAACSNHEPRQNQNHKFSANKPIHTKTKDHIDNSPREETYKAKNTKQGRNCEPKAGNANETKRPSDTDRRHSSTSVNLTLDPETKRPSDTDRRHSSTSVNLTLDPVKKFKQGTFTIQSSKDVKTKMNSLLQLLHEKMWMFLIGGVVVLAVFGCFNLFKKADFHPPDMPHYGIRAKRDLSTGKGQITNPVLKKDDPLRISFTGSNTSCSVFIDNKSISSKVDQKGKYRVYQNGTFCFLDIHQFSLGNHSIDKPIQVDSSLIRIGNDNLMDLITNGLVVYGTAVQNARVAEVSFSEVGNTANCSYGTMVNATVSKYKLILTDGKSLNVIQKKIVYNRCSSFQVNCTVGEQNFPLMIPQCLVDTEDQTHQSAIIGGFFGAVFCIGISVFLIYCYRKKGRNSSPPNQRYNRCRKQITQV